MFVDVIFHLFYVLVKFMLYLWWELNLKVIPIKYGRELTQYKLESNISTKHSHAPPTVGWWTFRCFSVIFFWPGKSLVRFSVFQCQKIILVMLEQIIFVIEIFLLTGWSTLSSFFFFSIWWMINKKRLSIMNKDYIPDCSVLFKFFLYMNYNFPNLLQSKWKVFLSFGFLEITQFPVVCN